ncbi:uncharacterized protein RJT21DRAFT_114031 [Scheffersomyces amazonensis]|uniref:uncharacterized protein n=1 Tax=Scheffersomyces amazonensis TaxID=1078765 RepID=UPI00315DD8EF
MPDEILTRIIDHLNYLDVLDLSLVNSRLHVSCMNKLNKLVLCFKLQHYAIILRKWNTVTHKNFTIVKESSLSPDKLKELLGVWNLQLVRFGLSTTTFLTGLSTSPKNIAQGIEQDIRNLVYWIKESYISIQDYSISHSTIICS